MVVEALLKKTIMFLENATPGKINYLWINKIRGTRSAPMAENNMLPSENKSIHTYMQIYRLPFKFSY
jgi:hypothetical protein